MSRTQLSKHAVLAAAFSANARLEKRHGRPGIPSRSRPTRLTRSETNPVDRQERPVGQDTRFPSPDQNDRRSSAQRIARLLIFGLGSLARIRLSLVPCSENSFCASCPGQTVAPVGIIVTAHPDTNRVSLPCRIIAWLRAEPADRGAMLPCKAVIVASTTKAFSYLVAFSARVAAYIITAPPISVPTTSAMRIHQAPRLTTAICPPPHRAA